MFLAVSFSQPVVSRAATVGSYTLLSFLDSHRWTPRWPSSPWSCSWSSKPPAMPLRHKAPTRESGHRTFPCPKRRIRPTDGNTNVTSTRHQPMARRTATRRPPRSSITSFASLPTSSTTKNPPQRLIRRPQRLLTPRNLRREKDPRMKSSRQPTKSALGYYR